MRAAGKTGQTDVRWQRPGRGRGRGEQETCVTGSSLLTAAAITEGDRQGQDMVRFARDKDNSLTSGFWETRRETISEITVAMNLGDNMVTIWEQKRRGDTFK